MQSTDTTSCDPRTDSLPVNDDANRQLFYTRLQQVQGKEPKDIRNQVDQIFIHHFPSVKGDTNDRIVLLPDAAVKYPKLECRTSAKLQRLHINVCLGMSLAPLSLRGMFSSSSLAVVSQPRHGSTLISRPALPHRRWLVVVWLAVVSSADGLHSCAVAGVLPARPRRAGARSGLPCPVPACGRRGRLAGAGSGSCCKMEFGRSMTR